MSQFGDKAKEHFEAGENRLRQAEDALQRDDNRGNATTLATIATAHFTAATAAAAIGNANGGNR